MRFVVLTAAMLVGYGQLAAAERVWTGAGNNSNWSTTGNWSGGVPPTDNDTVRFNATSISRLNNSCDLTLIGISIIIADPAEAVSISVSVSGSLSLGAGGVDMSTATQDLSLDDISLGADQAWTVAAGRNLTPFDVDLGTAVLTLNGSGSVRPGDTGSTFSGVGGALIVAGITMNAQSPNHTFSGGVRLQSGVIRVYNSSTPTSGAITNGPLGTGTITLSGGAIRTHQSSSRTLANPVVIDGSCTIGNEVSDTGALTFTGGLAISGSPTVTVQGTGKTFSTLACNLASDLNVAGAGNLTLSGGLTFTGFDPTLTLNGTATTTIAGAITNAAGTNTLTLAGSAQAALANLDGACGGIIIDGADVLASGAGNLTGGFTISSGRLSVSGSSSPTSPPLAGGTGPLGAGTLTVLGGAIFGKTNTPTLANPLVIQASCTFGGDGASVERDMTFTGGVTISGDPTLTYIATKSHHFTTTPVTLNSDVTVIQSGAYARWSGGLTTASDRRLTVNEDGLVTSILNLAGPLAGSGSLTLAGTGHLDFNTGTLSGSNGGIVLDGPRLDARAAGTFSNSFELRSGLVRLQTSTSGSPPTLSTGPLGIGTVILAGGRLGCLSNASRTLGNAITLAGGCDVGDLVQVGAITLSGAITQTAPSTLATTRNLSLQGTIDNGGHLLTIAGLSGTTCTLSATISGAGGLRKEGASTFNLGQSHNYSGPTTVAGGTLSLNGTTGRIASSSALSLIAGTFQINNSNASDLDRLGDSIDLSMQGGTFAMFAPTGNDRSETIGRLLVQAGASSITLTANGSRDCHLVCSDATLGLVRTAGASLRFNRNPGGSGTAKLLVDNGLADDSWLPWCSVTESGTTRSGQYDSTPLDGIVQSVALASTHTTQAPGNWSSGATWVGGSAPTPGSTVTILHDVSMDVNSSVAWIQFDTATSTGSITGGSTLTLTEALTVTGSGSPSIACALALGASVIDCNHAGSGTLTIAGVISGSNTLNVLGGGTVVLSGANTFSGGCSLSDGVLELGIDSTGAVTNGPVGTGTLTIAGGTLRAGGGARAIANTIQLEGGFTIAGSNDLTLSGATTLGAEMTMTVDNSGSTIFSSAVGGASDWTKAGSGTLRLSGANSFTGELTITGGMLQAWNDNALGTTAGGVLITDAATLDLGGGSTITGETVTLGAVDGSTIGSLSSSTGTNTWAGPVLVQANGCIINCDADSLTIGGAIRNGITYGSARSLIIDGAGTVIAADMVGSASAPLSGITKQGAGTFTTALANAIADPISMTVSAGTWDLSNGDEQIVSLAGSGAVKLGSGNLTLSDCGGGTYSGVISGSGAVTASGNWTLSGQSTFSGGLTYATNTLTIAADSTPTTPVLTSGPLGTGTFTMTGTVADDGSLRTVGNAISVMTDGSRFTIGGNLGLTFSGPVTLHADSSRIDVTEASCVATFAGVIADGGKGYAFHKEGPGTLVLSGTNTFSGSQSSFHIKDGTLSIASEANLGTGSGLRMYATDNPTLRITGNLSTAKEIRLYDGDQAAISVAAGMTATWNGIISRNQDLTKTGAGTLVLGAANTYGSGKQTLVSEGVLVLANSSGSGAGSSSIAVASGATLAGTGSCSGAVSMASGSTLAPGHGGVGSLTTGDLSLAANTALNLDLGASSDQVLVSGSLTCDGDLTVSDSGSFAAGTYTLFTYGSVLTDNRIAIASLPGSTKGRIDTTIAPRIDLQVSTGNNSAPAQVASFVGPINIPDAGTAGPSDDLIDTYGRVLNPRPRLIWDVPTDTDGQQLHFQVYLDSTDASTQVGDSTVAAQRGRFTWYNGASWVAVPGDGVTAGSGQIRYTPNADLNPDDDHFYIIRVTDGSAETDSGTQRFIVADRTWTDSLAAGSAIRVIHMTELREEANRARNAYGLADIAWTDPTITAGATLIRATHFNELRNCLIDVRNLTGTSVTIGAEVITAGVPVKSGHISELRDALDGL